MLHESDLIAFVASSDLERSRAFYEDTLGLTVTEENPVAIVFDGHGTMLRVTRVAEVSAAPYTVLGWAVSDIRATVRGLSEKGVVLEEYEGMGQDEMRVWTAPNGDLVAWFKDPDGNTLSITQFAGR